MDTTTDKEIARERMFHDKEFAKKIERAEALKEQGSRKRKQTGQAGSGRPLWQAG